MEIKLLSQEEYKLSFEIEDTDHVLTNTLRRTIAEEVPTLAIEEATFRENSSALYDEMIAARLGLVPLKTDLKSYVLPAEAKNESDPSAFVNFKLKTKGPGKVYASDLKSQDPKIQPVYQEMIIVSLLKNQVLELEATAILGQGKTHMKFSPGLAYYHQKAKVAVKQKDPGEFRNKYPSQIFDKNDNIDPKLINTPQLIDACKNINKSIIEVKEDPNSFTFYLESWGQLSVKEIMKEAIKKFSDKLDEFEKQIKKLK